MTTSSSDLIMAGLRAPFHPDDLEWRINSAGRSKSGIWAQVLCYVTSRAIQERFDKVCGANWQIKQRFESFTLDGKSFVACIASLGVKLDGEWVWREDGADPSDIEAVKGALSGGVKRAAVMWGCGRDLYKLEENWAIGVTEKNPDDNSFYKAYVTLKGAEKEKATFWWKPPVFPKWYMELLDGAPAKTEPAKPTKLLLTKEQVDIIITSFADKGVSLTMLQEFIGEKSCDWTPVHGELLRNHYKTIKRTPPA